MKNVSQVFYKKNSNLGLWLLNPLLSELEISKVSDVGGFAFKVHWKTIKSKIANAFSLKLNFKKVLKFGLIFASQMFVIAKIDPIVHN